MSHQVEIRDGVASMMYAGEPPWHGLGQAVEKEVTSAAAIKLAGLDWKVEKRRLGIISDQMIDDIPVVKQEVPGWYAAVRAVDSKVLSIVTETYEVIQNQDQFDFMDSLVGEGLAMYHTAGSLCDGRRIFLLVKLPGDYKIADEKVEKFLLLTSSHDYSTPLRVLWTPIRVVCWNTLSAALQGLANSVSIRHTKNWRGKQEEARRVLGLAEGYYQRLKEEMEQLALVKLGGDILQRIVEDLFPVTSPRTAERVATTRADVMQLFKSGRGCHGQSALDLYNAVVEYYDHTERKPSKWYSGEEHRFLSATEDRAGLKRKAFELLRSL